MRLKSGEAFTVATEASFSTSALKPASISVVSRLRLDAQQEFLHVRAGQHIERAKRFVEQKEALLGGERPGDTDALAQATGQFPDALVASIRKADAVEKHAGTRTALATGMPFSLKGKAMLSRASSQG